MMGFVYAIRWNDRVKIGHSLSPRNRLNKIASDPPYPVELIGYVRGSLADESALHSRFSELRRHGEWFALEGAVSEWLLILVSVPRRKPDAGHPLLAHLKANGESVTDFARRIGFSRMRVYRIVKGENTFTESIKQLVAATNGEVPVTAFIGELQQ